MDTMTTTHDCRVPGCKTKAEKKISKPGSVYDGMWVCDYHTRIVNPNG